MYLWSILDILVFLQKLDILLYHILCLASPYRISSKPIYDVQKSIYDISQTNIWHHILVYDTSYMGLRYIIYCFVRCHILVYEMIVNPYWISYIGLRYIIYGFTIHHILLCEMSYIGLWDDCKPILDIIYWFTIHHIWVYDTSYIALWDVIYWFMRWL